MGDKNVGGKQGRGGEGHSDRGVSHNNGNVRRRAASRRVNVDNCADKTVTTEPMGKRAKHMFTAQATQDLTPVPGRPLPVPGRPLKKAPPKHRKHSNAPARPKAAPSSLRPHKAAFQRVRPVATPVRRQPQHQDRDSEGDASTGEAPTRTLARPARHTAVTAKAKAIDKSCKGTHSRPNSRTPGLPSAVGSSSLQYESQGHRQYGCAGSTGSAGSQPVCPSPSRCIPSTAQSEQERPKPKPCPSPLREKNEACERERPAAAQVVPHTEHHTSNGKMHRVHMPERSLEFRQCRVPRRRQDLPGATTPLPFIVDGFLSQAEIATLYQQGATTCDATISGNHRMRALEWSPLFTKIARRATMLVPRSWDLDHVYVGDFVLLQQCRDTDTMDQVIHADGTDGLSVIVCINSTPIPCTQHFGGGVSAAFQGIDNWMMHEDCRLMHAPAAEDLSKALAGYTLFDPELKLEGEVMLRKGDACVFSQTAWHRGPRWRRRKVIFFQIRKRLPGLHHPGQIFNWTMPLFLLGDGHRICRLILALVIKRGRADFLHHMYTEEQMKRLKRSISRKFAKTPLEDIVAELRQHFPVITGTIQRAHVPRISVGDLNVRKYRRRMAAAAVTASPSSSQETASHPSMPQVPAISRCTAAVRSSATDMRQQDDGRTGGSTEAHTARAHPLVSAMPVRVSESVASTQQQQELPVTSSQLRHYRLPPRTSALASNDVVQARAGLPVPAAHDHTHHHDQA